MNRSSLATLTLLIAGGLAQAGPLDPPAGPVGPTFKTPAEVEPRTAIGTATTPGDADSVFKITTPGSYFLTANVQGQIGKMGIEIALPSPGRVSIDLNGFEVIGIADSLDGIRSTIYGQFSVSIRNGSVRGWDGDGLNLTSTAGGEVCGVAAFNNFGSGIVGGPCIVHACSARNNAKAGISVAGGGIARACAAEYNGLHGIYAYIGCTIESCVASYNTGNGIGMMQDGTVRDNVSSWNGGNGIIVGGSCRVADNLCANNGTTDGAGILVSGYHGHIAGNTCTGADRGIEVDFPNNFIVRNACASNTIDWIIAANNVMGPIVDRRAAAAPAMSGFSAAGTLGTTDPNANFSY